MNILLSLLVIGLVGWMIIKKYKPQSVLIAAGLLLMLMAYFLGYADNFVPEKQRTGFIFFDMFEYLRRTTSKDLAGLGLTIMAVTGFAKYMDHIGASSSLVRLAMKPLSKVKCSLCNYGIQLSSLYDYGLSNHQCFWPGYAHYGNHFSYFNSPRN